MTLFRAVNGVNIIVYTSLILDTVMDQAVCISSGEYCRILNCN